MALSHDDLRLTDAQLARLNDAVRARLDAFHRDHPDADPPAYMSVSFHFVFGIGRQVEVDIDGLSLELDLEG